VIVLNNSAPLQTGLRGTSGGWTAATGTFLGNYDVYNSTPRAPIRANDAAIVGVLIYDNDLEQHLSARDPASFVKTTIVLRAANYVLHRQQQADERTCRSRLDLGWTPASRCNGWSSRATSFTRPGLREGVHAAPDDPQQSAGHLGHRADPPVLGDIPDPLSNLVDVTITHNTA